VPSLKAIDYSLAILYQLSAGSYSKVQTLLKSKMPLWFVAGTQTDLQGLNANQKAVKALAGREEVQEIFAQPVTSFSAFTLSDSTLSKLGKLPPLLAQFGSYEAAAICFCIAQTKNRERSNQLPITGL
jgi:hypothetical protein